MFNKDCCLLTYSYFILVLLRRVLAFNKPYDRNRVPIMVV